MPEHSRTFTATNTVIGGAIAAIIAAYVVYLFGFSSNGDDAPAPSRGTSAQTTQNDDSAVLDDNKGPDLASSTNTLGPVEQTIPLVNLDDVDSSGGSTEGTLQVNGSVFTQSPLLRSSRNPSAVSYNLGRHFRTFKAHVGFDDRSPRTEPVRISVIDESGNILWRRDMGLGSGEDVVLDVTNVLRLTLQGEPIESTGWEDRTVGFGDAVVIGTPPANFLGE